MKNHLKKNPQDKSDNILFNIISCPFKENLMLPIRSGHLSIW